MATVESQRIWREENGAPQKPSAWSTSLFTSNYPPFAFSSFLRSSSLTFGSTLEYLRSSFAFRVSPILIPSDRLASPGKIPFISAISRSSPSHLPFLFKQTPSCRNRDQIDGLRIQLRFSLSYFRPTPSRLTSRSTHRKIPSNLSFAGPLAGYPCPTRIAHGIS